MGSGNLDDLEFALDVDLQKSLEGLREVVSSLDIVKSNVAGLRPSFDALNAATVRLAGTTAFVGTPAEMLAIKLGYVLNTIERLDAQTGRFEKTMEDAAQLTPGLSEHWQYITRDVKSSTNSMQQFVAQTQAAAAAIQTITIDTANNKMQPKKQAPFEMVKLASAALAMKAITGVTKSVTSARVALQDISKTTTMSVTAMDRFRLAMYAPKVNPAFNILKTAIDAVSGSASKATEYLRKTADAVMSDLPGALGVAVTGLGKLVGSLDRSQLTASKWISKLQTLSGGMKLFGFVFGSSSRNASLLNAVLKFAQPLLEKFSTLIDRGNQYLKMLLETAREAGQVLTGTFTQTGTSADLYARAAWAATVPTRLLAREMEGGARVVKVAKFAFMAITSPIHAVTLAVRHSSAEFRELQSRMPQLQNSVGIVKTVMGATTATVRQLESAFRMVRIAATDASVAFVSSSPRSSSAILRVRDSLQSMGNFAKQSVGSFASSFPRITAVTNTVTNAMKILRDGALKPIAAEAMRAGQIIGAKLSADISRSVAAVTKYVQSWELGIRAHRALSITLYAASKALSAVTAVAVPVARGIIGVASASYRALNGMKNMASGVVSLTAKLTGLNAVASVTKSTVSGGFSSIAGKASMANLAITGLAAGAIAMSANFAMATEKNQAVFGTMVHDMEQGKAIVASIQNTKAAGLFDNQQLLDSSRLLFKGGVAAVDLSAKTDQLAKIAAGTSTELGDLARIYQQGANRGSFGQDKINQLSERGIAIYEGLQHATGKSGAALDKMISDGKIGVTEMDAAMEYLTTGTGYYANSLEDIGNTSSGMLSQIKNNLMQTLGSIGGVGNEAFKPVLAGILAMSEGIKSSVGAIAPIVNQLFAVIKGAFSGMHAVVNTTYTSIFGATTATFGGMFSVVMEWVTKFRWFFENIVPIVQFVGLSMTSIMVTAFNDIAFFFTDKFPAYFAWFVDNVGNIMYDLANIVVTVLGNLGTNVKMAFTELWDFITSLGTDEMELVFVPLLDGFESTIAKLPEIAERAMTETELGLTAQTQEIATQLADSFDALNVEAQAALTVAPPELPAIDPSLGGGMKTGEDTGTGKNNRSDFSVSGMERGSEAALKAIFSAQKDKTPSQALAEHKKTNAHLAKIASRAEPAVLGGVS